MTQHINPLLFEEEHLVRQVDRDGEVWFVGLDICRVLEIAKAHQALDRLDDDERGTYTVGTPGGDQEMIVVSEAGVYALVFTSRKPVARRFKRWLAHEVIPSIRKTGSYSATKQAETAPEDVEARESDSIKLRKVNECSKIFGLRAAAQLWFKLGLEDVPAMHLDPRQITIWDYSNIKTAETA